MEIPEAYKKTVKFKIRVDNGQIIPLDKNFPKLINGTIADLIVPISYLKDENEKKEFILNEEKVICSKNTEFRFVLYQIYEDKNKTRKVFSIRLEEDLKFKIHNDYKLAKCKECKCVLFDGKDEYICESLNSAYTKASELYESKRISHTTNIFDSLYFRDGDHWSSLNKLRENECKTKDKEQMKLR